MGRSKTGAGYGGINAYASQFAEDILHAYRGVDDAMIAVVGSPFSLSASSAYGVNDRGQIVGEPDGRAFLCQNGETLDLGTLPGDRASRARGINASGQVIGESIAADGASRAILLQAGAMVAVGTLTGDVTSGARGINASAQVIGESLAANGASRAFLWKNGHRAPG